MVEEVNDGQQTLNFERFCAIIRHDSRLDGGFRNSGFNEAAWIEFKNRDTREINFQFSGPLSPRVSR